MAVQLVITGGRRGEGELGVGGGGGMLVHFVVYLFRKQRALTIFSCVFYHVLPMKSSILSSISFLFFLNQ